MPIDLSERIKGSLLGGALGDALGAAYENRKTSFQFELPDRLSITDDTQLTLAICESILGSNSIDPDSIAQKFLDIHQSIGIRGIGSSTLMAMNALFVGGHWASVGATGERAAGNGAAMRIAPLAFILDPNHDPDRTLFRDVSRITHHNDEAIAGALAIAFAIRRALEGMSIGQEMLEYLILQIPDSVTRDRLKICLGEGLNARAFALRFGSTGYVADSVPLSILNAIDSSDFLDTVEEIISIGGDTDTIASMFGQIYGALKGLASLPLELLERLVEREYVEKVVNEFAAFVVES